MGERKSRPAGCLIIIISPIAYLGFPLYFGGALKNQYPFMKATIYLAVLAIVFSSCKKDPFTVPDVTPQPQLQAKIFPVINEPREAVLGDTSAVFSVGERITIYVPYEAAFDEVSSATLIVTDESGDVMDSFAMGYSHQMMVGEMNVPQALQGSSFVFAIVEVGELYSGKTLSLQTQISGSRTVSDDYLPNAFSVRN
jgi:hypothetical protein